MQVAAKTAVKMRWNPNVFRLVFVVLCGVAVSHAESIQAGIDAGLARKTDSGRDGWAVGGQVLTRFGGLLGFGLRASYAEFDVSSKTIPPITVPIMNLSATGKLSVTEIVPSMRIWSPRLLVRLFGQAGAGMAIHCEKIQAMGILMGMPWQLAETRASVGWTLNIGGGLSLVELMGLSLEVMPLFHVAWDDGANHQFVTTNLGLSFNF